MLMKFCRALFSSISLIMVQYTRGREVTRSLPTDGLKELLPMHYDKYTAPATDQEPVTVYFDMKLLDITSINENDMTFSVESFVTYRWKDWRIRWPLDNQERHPCWNSVPENITKPLQFSEICTNNYTTFIDRCVDKEPEIGKRIILPITYLEKIWQPDAFFKNGIRSSIHKDWVTNEYLAFYTADGHIRLFSRFSSLFICQFKFHYYPHDKQTCEMRIESLSYKSDTVRFEWCESWAHAESKLDHDIFSLPHFALTEYEHEVCNSEYACVKAVFVLLRYPDFHMLHTYVPTVLIVILSWMSFWIAPDATPARVTLGVTSILTMATQYSQSTKNLPPVSYIKSLDIWMITCMVYVFAALLEFSIVYHVHYRRTNAEVQHIISPTANGPSQVFGVSSERLARWRNFWRGDTAIDEASRILFPLTYFSFVAGYFVLLTGSQQQGSLPLEIPERME